MTIEFKCDCGEILLAPDELAGRKGRCPACQNVLEAPAFQPHSAKIDEVVQAVEVTETAKVTQPAEATEAVVVTETDEVLETPEVVEPLVLKEVKTVRRKKRAKRTGKAKDPAASSIISLLLSKIRVIVRGNPKFGIFGAMATIFVVFLIVVLTSGGVEEKEGDIASQELSAVRKEMPSTEIREEPSIDIPAVREEKPIPVVEKQIPIVEKPKEEGVKSLASLSTEKPKAGFKSAAPSDSTAGEPSATRAEKTSEKPGGRTERPIQVQEPRKTKEAYAVNLATFQTPAKAEKYVSQLKTKGIEAFHMVFQRPKKSNLHRVSAGRFFNREQAQSFARKIEKKLQIKTFVYRLPEDQVTATR